MIRLAKSCLSEAEKAAVLGVLDREYLGMGAEVQSFEQALAAYLNRQAVCVSTGTGALHLALQAIGCKPHHEVLVQSLTFVASFQAIAATGATPVSCDILPETLTIDLADAEKRLTERTIAIMPVHYSGGVGNLDEVYAFAARHKLRVVEDASHAFGTIYQGRPVGSFGDIACFSFDGIKNITSGEGGAIISADADVLRRVQDARLLGVENDTVMRYAGARSWKFDVHEQGWRYHMSNIMAAIGIEQLKRFPELSRIRQERARHYQKRLAECGALRLLAIDYTTVVPHIFPVRLLLHEPPRHSRETLQAKLNEAGIQTGFHYLPNHTLSLFRTDYCLPTTEMIFPQLLTLPLHPDLTTEQVDFICDTLLRELRTS